MTTAQEKRNALLKKIGSHPPCLRGSISTVCAKCGRAKCICMEPSSRQAYRLTYKNAHQKTRTVYVPERELPTVRKMIANYHEFRTLVEQLIEANVEVFKEESRR